MADILQAPTNSRNVAAAAVSWIPLVVVVVSWLAWREVLPSEVASRFGSQGEVTSTLPTLLLVGIAALVCFVAAAVSSASVNRDLETNELRRTLLVAGVLSGLAAAVWLIIAGIAVVAPAGSAPVMGGWGLLAPLAGVFGLMPYLISAKDSPRPINPALPEMTLTSSQAGVWIETINVPLFAWISGAATAGTVALLLVVPPNGWGFESVLTFAVLIVILLLSLSLARLRVLIDNRGVRIASAILFFPWKVIPLAEIMEARVDALQPEQWGGWGFRVMPGRSGLILSGGTGLTVRTTRGKEFSVSLRNPQTPAALLNAMRAATSVAESP